MRIGLLSDSHGRAATTRQAVNLLLEERAQTLIHLGDIGSVEVVDALVAVPSGADEPVPTYLVFGNVDWDAESLGDYAERLGIAVARDGAGFLGLPEGLLAFLHGHDSQAMAAALARQPRWLCHGHSHRMLDSRAGQTRIINPGALFRASEYTVALLDTQQDDVVFHGLVQD